MSFLSDLLKDNRIRKEDLPSFEAKLFFEGSRHRAYLIRFTVLLFLSTIIASYGVINNSGATVIGAMIIAPLMTPIMATAASLVIGNIPRALRSVALVAAGVFLVIFVSWIIGSIFSIVNIITISQNGQIAGRISPRFTDLAVAMASGAAGAFALSREDVADSLPGVAISISLVPPLCVVGITLAISDWMAAWGAMLLFLTNFLSIILAGGGVLALLGLERAAVQVLDKHSRRRAFIAVAIGILLVSIPLALTSLRLARQTVIESLTIKTTQEWLGDSQYDIRQANAAAGEVTVLIAGQGALPDTTSLAGALQEQIGNPIILNLEIVPIQKERIEIEAPEKK